MEDLNAAASRALDAQRDTLAEAMTDLHYQLQPELAVRYGEAGRAKCRQDAGYHLSYLADAIAAGSPALFADYVAWAKVMLGSRGIPAADLAVSLNVLRDVLRQNLAGDLALLASGYVEPGLQQLPKLPTEVPCALGEGRPLGRWRGWRGTGQRERRVRPGDRRRVRRP